MKLQTSFTGPMSLTLLQKGYRIGGATLRLIRKCPYSAGACISSSAEAKASSVVAMSSSVWASEM